MQEYFALLHYLEISEPCTRLKLEHFSRGIYKDQIDECISLNYIMKQGKNSFGEDLYFITTIGKAYLRK